MATDTTETTFVRCPACRSLVPAVSTRCRMCGATLDAGAAAESSQPQASSTRVRQKTMTTASSGDMADQVNKIRDEMSAAPAETPPPPPAPEAPAAKQAAPTSDPLGGYLEGDDMEVDEDLLADDEFDDDDFDDFEDDEVEDHAEEPISEPEVEEPVMEAQEEVPPPPPPPAPKKEEPAKVVVDQSKARAAAPKNGSAKQQDGGQRRFDVAQPPRVAKETKEPAPVKEPTPPVREAAKEQVRETNGRTKDVLKKGEELGKLYGWLVSFVDPDGSSIELREGRFFVSGTQLRPTDMVFEDETISTPHAMFTISAEDGIVIQDLKSERGVFIREDGSSAYRREYDSSSLHHGDWVRFGDLEFLVSVIAGAGK